MSFVPPSEPVTEVPAPPHLSAVARFTRSFSPLKRREFRLVWLGALSSTTGTWMQTVAQAWLVLSLTKSAFYLGVDAFLAMLPMILFSLIGGVIADRLDRRIILLISQCAQMTFAAVLATLIYTNVVLVWHIFLLSFLTGTAQAFSAPAYQALLPSLVTRDEIPKAIALNSTQFNLARMIGPVLAGLALTTVGAAACFALNALSFIPVIISYLLLKSAMRPDGAARKSVLGDMADGFRFLAQQSAIMQLTLLAFIGTFFGVPLMTLLPVVAKNIFALDARGYSWMLTTYAAGSLAGAFLFASRSDLARRGRFALISQLTYAIALLFFARTSYFPLALLFVFFCGAALMGVIGTISSLVQLATSEVMRGRVMSIFNLAFRGAMPLGSLFSGWMTERSNVMFALTLNAIAMAILALSFLFSRNAVRQL